MLSGCYVIYLWNIIVVYKFIINLLAPVLVSMAKRWKIFPPCACDSAQYAVWLAASTAMDGVRSKLYSFIGFVGGLVGGCMGAEARMGS